MNIPGLHVDYGSSITEDSVRSTEPSIRVILLVITLTWLGGALSHMP